MNYKIIADSCCDLTEEMKNWKQLEIIPLTLQLGDYSIFDDNNFNQDDFIAKMNAFDGIPRSACPSPQAYCSAIEESDADDVYILTITDKLSGSYNSAVQGKELYEEEHPGEKNVYVFNSLSTSGGETLVAQEINRLASSGVAFNDVINKVNKYIVDNTALYFVLESLDALKNNGRLFSIAATVVKKLRMKLICNATPEGTIGLAGQDFAVNRALRKMCDFIAKDVDGIDLSDKEVIITHVCCEDKAEDVKSKLLEKCPFGKATILKMSGLNSLYAQDGGIIVSYTK